MITATHGADFYVITEAVKAKKKAEPSDQLAYGLNCCASNRKWFSTTLFAGSGRCSSEVSGEQVTKDNAVQLIRPSWVVDNMHRQPSSAAANTAAPIACSATGRWSTCSGQPSSANAGAELIGALLGGGQASQQSSSAPPPICSGRCWAAGGCDKPATGCQRKWLTCSTLWWAGFWAAVPSSRDRMDWDTGDCSTPAWLLCGPNNR